MSEANNAELNPGLSPEAPHDEAVSRRHFVQVAVGGMCLAYLGAVGYPIYRYLESPVEKSEVLAAVKNVDLNDAQKMPAGSAMMFKFGPYPSMLIHHKSGEWVAFNAVCSHLGCTVQYHPELEKITCACHGGQYDPHTGQNIGGPPPKPLEKFVVTVNASSVTVSRA